MMQLKICNLDFILPKGSYATVLVEYLANRNFLVNITRLKGYVYKK